MCYISVFTHLFGVVERIELPTYRLVPVALPLKLYHSFFFTYHLTSRFPSWYTGYLLLIVCSIVAKELISKDLRHVNLLSLNPERNEPTGTLLHILLLFQSSYYSIKAIKNLDHSFHHICHLCNKWE